MTIKLKFFFTENHTRTVTNVSPNNFYLLDGMFTYSTAKYKDGIHVESTVTVDMRDVLYIEVLHDAHGSVEVIPGLITKFTVTPSEDQLQKINDEIEEAKQHALRFRAQKELKRRKIAARKKAQYAKDNGLSIQELEAKTKK